MTLELNKPYLVKRVGSEGQVLHYLPWEGFCDGVVLDKPVLAKRVANNAGVLHYLISDQKLEDDGTLTIDKPYLAKRVASNSGVLHYLVGGKLCVDSTVTVCDVTRCCTLDASVRIKLTSTPTWTDWETLNLFCGGQSYGTWSWSCLNDEVEDDTFTYYITYTFSEKDTLASPEAYDDGVSSGTRSCKSVIWSSGDFTINGDTYRLTYFEIEWHIFQTSPSVVTTDGCTTGYFLQKKYTDEFGDCWGTIAGTDAFTLGTIPAWQYNVTNDSPYDPEFCPEGYSNNGSEIAPCDGCSFDPAACAEIDIDDPCNTEDLV